jgi:diguanylate cyclase (GGDEF)-like protein
MDRFSRSQLLPDWVWDSDEQQSFFVRLLHQRDSIYGYCLIRYDEGFIPSIFFHQWNVTVSSALRHLFNQQKLQRLYEERRLSSITDPLTGLYNRRGLEELVMPAWRQRCLQGETITILSYDMDNLKPINDTHGHSAGDAALQMVAHALTHLDREGAVSARIGGDEFLMFLPDCDEQNAKLAMEAIEAELQRQNIAMGARFEVGMSGGSYTMALTPDSTLEKCIRQSDERMYSIKRQRKMRSKMMQ